MTPFRTAHNATNQLLDANHRRSGHPPYFAACAYNEDQLATSSAMLVLGGEASTTTRRVYIRPLTQSGR